MLLRAYNKEEPLKFESRNDNPIRLGEFVYLSHLYTRTWTRDLLSMTCFQWRTCGEGGDGGIRPLPRGLYNYMC